MGRKASIFDSEHDRTIALLRIRERLSKMNEVSEEQRRIAELEALIAGQASEIDRLNKELDKCESGVLKLVSALEAAKRRIESLTKRSRWRR